MTLLFGFSGRIGRGEWWLGQLAMLIVLCVGFGILFLIASTGELSGADLSDNAGLSVLAVLGCIVVLISWIHLATTVKRFHDRDKSGVWFLISFVPIIGGVWVLVECGMLPGSSGMNDYGPSGGSGGRPSIADGFLDMDELQKSEAPRLHAAPTVSLASGETGRPRKATPSGFGRRGA